MRVRRLLIGRQITDRAETLKRLQRREFCCIERNERPRWKITSTPGAFVCHLRTRGFNRPARRDRARSGVFIVCFARSLARSQIEPDRGSQERDSAAAGAAVGGA